uniref:Uncharacterized protein n=1 Tax=Balaenoptera musculus TaxID=9771 RepID=A0A8C0DZI3_BALMU
MFSLLWKGEMERIMIAITFGFYLAPVSLPIPGHYRVLNRGCGETQLGWHGETYCLVGGYRAYGDVPLATPEKVEAEKPVARRSDEDLGCPRPKLRRLHLTPKSQVPYYDLTG